MTPLDEFMGFTADEWARSLQALDPPPTAPFVEAFLQRFLIAPAAVPPALSLTKPLLRALAENCDNGRQRVETLLAQLPQELRDLLTGY